MNRRTQICTSENEINYLDAIREADKINMATILLDKFDYKRTQINQDEAAILVESSIFTSYYDGDEISSPLFFDKLHKIPLKAKIFKQQLIAIESFKVKEITYEKCLININLDDSRMFFVNIVTKVKQNVYLDNYKSEFKKLKMVGFIKEKQIMPETNHQENINTSSSGSNGYGLDLI